MRLIVLLLLLASPAAAQERRLTGRIRTRLVDTVTVRLMDGDTVVREKRLTKNGDFSWRVKPGIYRFEARAQHHAWWFLPNLRLYRRRTEINARLEPGVTLRGRVVRNSVPEGKTVIEVGNREVTCEKDGRFVVRNLPPQAGYSVRLHHNYGMVGEDETDLIRYRHVTPGPKPIDLTLEPDQEFRFVARLPEGADEIEGWLITDGLGHRVFLFHVHRGKQGQSRIFRGQRGKFYDYSARRKAAFVRVPGVARGKHRFVVRARGCDIVRRDVVVDGPTEFAVELKRRRGRVITIDAPDGWFRVTGGIDAENIRGFLSEGAYEIRFYSDRYMPQTRTIRITDGKEPLLLEFPLVPAPAAAGTLQAVADASLTICPEGESPRGMDGPVTPGDDPRHPLRRTVKVSAGRFRTGGLPPGRYDVWLWDVKLATFELGSEPITLNLKLPE